MNTYWLYADVFKNLKALSDSRSGTIIHHLPMGFSLPLRSCLSCTRAFASYPDDQSVNEATPRIIDDSVDGMTEGAHGRSSDGSVVHMLLDLLSLFGDYCTLPTLNDTISPMKTCFLLVDF